MNYFLQKDIKNFLVDNTKKSKKTSKHQLRATELFNCYVIWCNFEYGSHDHFRGVDKRLFYKALRKAGELGVYREGELYFVGLLFNFTKHATHYKDNTK